MGKRCREPNLVLLFNGFGGGDPFCGFFDGGVDAGVPGRSTSTTNNAGPNGCSRQKDDGDAEKKRGRTQDGSLYSIVLN
jgi:hypothetical protein